MGSRYSDVIVVDLFVIAVIQTCKCVKYVQLSVFEAFKHLENHYA